MGTLQDQCPSVPKGQKILDTRHQTHHFWNGLGGWDQFRPASGLMLKPQNFHPLGSPRNVQYMPNMRMHGFESSPNRAAVPKGPWIMHNWRCTCCNSDYRALCGTQKEGADNQNVGCRGPGKFCDYAIRRARQRRCQWRPLCGGAHTRGRARCRGIAAVHGVRRD